MKEEGSKETTREQQPHQTRPAGPSHVCSLLALQPAELIIVFVVDRTTRARGNASLVSPAPIRALSRPPSGMCVCRSLLDGGRRTPANWELLHGSETTSGFLEFGWLVGCGTTSHQVFRPVTVTYTPSRSRRGGNGIHPPTADRFCTTGTWRRPTSS